jgi:hypothetical protein
VHKRIISAVEFVSDRMSYIILKGHWCHIIVLNVHAPTEDKMDVTEQFLSVGSVPVLSCLPPSTPTNSDLYFESFHKV